MATTADGFEVRFDDSALPEGYADDSYIVPSQAFNTAEEADVNAGYFLTPEQAAVQTVDLAGKDGSSARRPVVLYTAWPGTDLEETR